MEPLVSARVFVLGLFLAPSLLSADEKPALPPLQVEEITSPADPGTSSPVLARDRDGRVWMAWFEKNGTLRCSVFNSASGTWGAATAILAGKPADPELPAAIARLFDSSRGMATGIPVAKDAVSTPVVAPLLDGGALLAYRAYSEDGRLEPSLMRLHGRRWSSPHAIAPDSWSVDSAEAAREAQKAGPPEIAVDGGRVAAIWYTEAGGVPQILASTSPDAGTRFLQPERVDEGKPAGHPAIALLHDGAALALWAQSDGSLHLRRLTPEFYKDPPTDLGPAAAEIQGTPRIALASDYAGDVTEAKAIIAFTNAGPVSLIRTLLVTVPEGDLLLASDDACHCAPSPVQLLGYPLRGTIVSVSPDAGTATLDIDAVPGVMEAGRRDFKVNAGLLARLKPRAECLGRIELRDGAWSLFDARLLEAP